MPRFVSHPALAVGAALAVPAAAQTAPSPVARIIDEGTNHSQVMKTAEHLADVIGPRLTNSPAMRQAEAWTGGKFAEWGLTGVHKEAFPFGRGWWIERSSVRMLTPRALQLTAIPIAWTPATNGAISAPVVVAPMKTARDFARWHGKLGWHGWLGGRIVLISMQGVGVPGFQFILDPLDYEMRVHHSSIDTFDHLKADDMRQGSTILAAFLLNAANAKDPLPRPPLPTRPTASDPYQIKAED